MIYYLYFCEMPFAEKSIQLVSRREDCLRKVWAEKEHSLKRKHFNKT